jgi:CHAT domain-containing protein
MAATDSCRRRVPLRNRLIVTVVFVCVVSVVSSAAGPPGIQSQRECPPGQSEAEGQVLLELSKPISRGLSGGQSHWYELHPTAGQYLHFRVHQRGIDLVVLLYSPNGNKVVEMVTAIDGSGSIFWVVRTSGTYRVEVRSRERNAVGRYEAWIEALRQSVWKDNYRVEAEKRFIEGIALAERRNVASPREAIRKFLLAVAKWRAAGEQWQEGVTLNYIGELYDISGDNENALNYYNQALLAEREVGNLDGEAATLNGIGLVYSEIGEKQKALDYYNLALPIRQQIGDLRGEASTLNNIGQVYEFVGENEKALHYLKQALSARRQMSDWEGQAATLSDMARVYDDLGETERALIAFKSSLNMIQGLGGQYQEPVELPPGQAAGRAAQKKVLLRTLPIRGQLMGSGRQSKTLNNIGRIYNDLNNTGEALKYYLRALEIVRQERNTNGEAVILYNIGIVFYCRGDKQGALHRYDQALRLARKVRDRVTEASVLSGAALAHSHLGDFNSDLGTLQQARVELEIAIGIFDSLRTMVAGPEFRSSFFASIHDIYTLYVDVLMQMHKLNPAGGFAATALQACERGRARSVLEMLVEAHADIRSGVDPTLLERERSLQQLLASRTQRHIELADDATIGDQLTELDKEIVSLTHQYSELEALIRARSKKYADLFQPVPLEAKQIQQHVLEKDTLLLEYSLGDDRSYLWALGENLVTSYELPGRAEIELAVQGFRNWVSRAAESQSAAQGQFGRAARVTEDEDYWRAALKLSRIVLSPAAASLGEKRLLIVADGALEYVPFATLPDPAAPETESGNPGVVPLLVKHEVVSAPSASAVYVLRKELSGRKPAPKIIAILADPVFSPDDPRVTKIGPEDGRPPMRDLADQSLQQLFTARALNGFPDAASPRAGSLTRLPKSRQEADRIVSVLVPGPYKEALDFEASKSTATSADLSQYRYVHFATHGKLDAEKPEYTGLVLSLSDPTGRPVDGFLAVREVYNLKLPAEMVVLSACQTALGKQIRGEGLAGLTRGFMYAGAACVVATLWNVHDEATADLMSSFYKGVFKEGLRPVAALRAAQLEMLKSEKWSASYYWAAFVLQGEWR